MESQKNTTTNQNQSKAIANEPQINQNQVSEQAVEQQTGLTLSICSTTVSVSADGDETTISFSPFAGATISGPIILQEDKENDLITAKYEEVSLTLTAAIPSLDAAITVKIENFYADSEGKITGQFTEDVDLSVLAGSTLSLTKPTINKDDSASDFEISSSGTIAGAKGAETTKVLEASIGGGGINWAEATGKSALSFEFGDNFKITEAKMADIKGSGSDYKKLATGGITINAKDVVVSSKGASVTAKYNNRIDDGEIAVDGDLTLNVLGQNFKLSGLKYDTPTKALSGDSAELTLNINGHTETISITNPSLTKGAGGMAFGFESAKSESATEHSMFNKIVTLGKHSIELTKTTDDYEVEAKGLLKVNPIKEIEGEIQGGFTYSKKEGFSPQFASGTVKIKKDFNPIPGVTISDLFLGVEENEDKNKSLIGGGTLKLSINTPKVTGTGKDMKLAIDKNTKAVSFEVASITVTSELGDISINKMKYSNGEITADEGKFEFDSSKVTKGNYFGGAAAALMKSLKGLGVKFDITASDISISKQKGFNIGHAETKLNEVKIKILGLEAIYNIKEKKASIAKKTNLAKMLIGTDDIGVSMDFPIFPGVFATFGAGVRSKGEAEISIELAKTDENLWNLSLLANFDGTTLMAYIKGGVKVGNGWLASVYAELAAEGGIKLEAPSQIKANANFDTKGYFPKPDNLEVDMELNMPIILQLSFTLGFQALKFFKYEYTKVLAQKEITRFKPKKTFTWQSKGGSLNSKDVLNKDKVEKPVIPYTPNESHIREIEQANELAQTIMTNINHNVLFTILTDTQNFLASNPNANQKQIDKNEQDSFYEETQLLKAKQDKNAEKFINIHKADAEKFENFVKNIQKYKELEDSVGAANIDHFMTKMKAKVQISIAANKLKKTFTDTYIISNHGEEQVKEIKNFLDVYSKNEIYIME